MSLQNICGIFEGFCCLLDKHQHLLKSVNHAGDHLLPGRFSLLGFFEARDPYLNYGG